MVTLERVAGIPGLQKGVAGVIPETGFVIPITRPAIVPESTSVPETIRLDKGDLPITFISRKTLESLARPGVSNLAGSMAFVNQNGRLKLPGWKPRRFIQVPRGYCLVSLPGDSLSHRATVVPERPSSELFYFSANSVEEAVRKADAAIRKYSARAEEFSLIGETKIEEVKKVLRRASMNLRTGGSLTEEQSHQLGVIQERLGEMLPRCGVSPTVKNFKFPSDPIKEVDLLAAQTQVISARQAEAGQIVQKYQEIRAKLLSRRQTEREGLESVVGFLERWLETTNPGEKVGLPGTAIRSLESQKLSPHWQLAQGVSRRLVKAQGQFENGKTQGAEKQVSLAIEEIKESLLNSGEIYPSQKDG